MSINPAVEVLFFVIALLCWVTDIAMATHPSSPKGYLFHFKILTKSLLLSYFVLSQGQHQRTMTAGALQDLVLARVARAAEDPERAVRAEVHQVTTTMVHGEPTMVHGAQTMENGRPQDLARVNLGRAEVDQASRARAEEDRAQESQVSRRLYCFIN